MPIAYDYSEQEHYLGCRCYGVLTSSDIVSYFMDVGVSVVIKDFYEVVDLSDVEDMELRFSELAKIAKYSQIWLHNGHKATLFLAANGQAQALAQFLTPLFAMVKIKTLICQSQEDIVAEIAKL